jgi:hypothetical protein
MILLSIYNIFNTYYSRSQLHEYLQILNINIKTIIPSIREKLKNLFNRYLFLISLKIFTDFKALNVDTIQRILRNGFLLVFAIQTMHELCKFMVFNEFNI